MLSTWKLGRGGNDGTNRLRFQVHHVTRQEKRQRKKGETKRMRIIKEEKNAVKYSAISTVNSN